MKHVLGLALVASLAAGATASIYSNNFDSDTTANWNVNKGPNPDGSFADFFFDYSSYGIESAPNSGGTTRGMRLEANVTGGIFSGLSVSPTGLSVDTDFKLKADVWMNYVGPGPAGGSGSTQAGGLGFGTNGTTSQWAASAQSSVFFASTLDGNSSVDYRAYSSAAATGYGDGNAVFAAAGTGNRNHNHPYYAGFTSTDLPESQAMLFPSQTGSTLAGSIGFKWRAFEVERAGNSLSWSIDGLRIATVDLSTTTLSGSNILFTYFDTNAGVTSDPNRLNFMLVDNVEVVPEPASMTALALGAVALIRRRRAR